MNIINKFLLEYFPDHPNDIVLRNKFYPRGLKEIDIYNYYLSAKNKILDWIGNRNVAFFLRVDENLIMKRNEKGIPYKLTQKNFDSLITGRTNVVLVEHPSITNYFIIDIDPGKNISNKTVLKSVIYLKKILNQNIDDKIRYEIINSSFTGVHVIGYLSETIKLNSLREHIIKVLNDTISDDSIYRINERGRFSNSINFDLTPMYERSLHICKYSLTKEGLVCNDISKGIQKIRTKIK